MISPAIASSATATGPSTTNAITTSTTIAHWCTLRAVTSKSGRSSAESLTTKTEPRRWGALFPRVDDELAHPRRVEQGLERRRHVGQGDPIGHDAGHLRPRREQPQRLVEVLEPRVDAAGDGDLAGDPEDGDQRHLGHRDAEQVHAAARAGLVDRLLDRLGPARALEDER